MMFIDNKDIIVTIYQNNKTVKDKCSNLKNIFSINNDNKKNIRYNVS